MSKKYENNLDQAFFDQFEKMTNEELATVSGGIAPYNPNDWHDFAGLMYRLSIVAEAASGAYYYY
ncbi:MAG: bacteriocin class II family protein [Streptococcaceae bacterium]|jgi:lactobin A/cerein 7B family class IIb bacteriocin|nr:bacteriocin class II family protein [Streptococcaceae bacterium]